MRRSTVVWTLLLLFMAASGCVPDENVETDTSPAPDTTTVDARADAGSDAEMDAGGDTEVDASGDADAQTDTGPLPLTEEGPYNVGFETMEVTYQAEEDGTDEDRELRTVIWYPTEADDGPAGRYADLISRDEVIKGAEPAPVDEMPVLIFSHGNGGLAEQNYFMSEFWASRGWTVVSPEHTGNTFEDGAEINLEAAIYRPQDITAVLDRIDNLEQDHPLHGRLSDDIAMSGHSFGGYTTLANSGASYAVDDLRMRCENGNVGQDYCDVFNTDGRPELFRAGFYDERIDAAIPQAPAGDLIFQEGLEDIGIPTMLFTGGMDQTLPNEEEGDPIWRQMKGEEHRRMNLPKGGHFTFSNMCTVFNGIDEIENDGCSDDFIDPERAQNIINTYALAFARYHLFGDERAKDVIDGQRWPTGMMGFDLSVGAD